MVVGVGRVFIFILVTAIASVWRVVVIAIVTGGAVIGNVRMGAVQRIIAVVVREFRRHPIRLSRMASGTVSGKPQSGVVRIGRAIVVCLVTADAGVWCVVVIPVGMAQGTIVFNSLMRPRQWVNGIMIKSRGCPFTFRMALQAVRWELSCLVVRVIGLIVVVFVAAKTGVGSVVIIAIVALGAVVGNVRMGAVQCIVVVVVGESRRFPIRLCGMASSTIGGKPQIRVVWVRRAIIIRLVAADAGVRCVVVITVVAFSTIIRNIGVRPIQNIIIVVVRELSGFPTRIGGVARSTVH